MPNNSNTDFYGKKAFISKGFALLLGIAAIYMLLGVWIPIITKHKFESLFDFIFLFFFPIPCTLLAIYFFHTAGIIWGEISSRGIRKFSICLSLLLAALLLILISGIRKSISQSDEVFWAEVGTSVIMVTTGLFYLLVKRWIFMCFSVNEVIDYDAHRRATKLYFGFLGLSIWSDIVAITVFLPKGHKAPKSI